MGVGHSPVRNRESMISVNNGTETQAENGWGCTEENSARFCGRQSKKLIGEIQLISYILAAQPLFSGLRDIVCQPRF
jgi:hypothetical protein